MAKRRWKNSMTGQFVLFGIILIILLAVTFTLSNGISRKILVAHSSRSGEQILLQIKNSLDDFNKNVENILTNLGYSPTIVQYFKSEVSEQILLQNDVLMVLGNTEILLDNIQGICLYDSEGVRLIDFGEYTKNTWENQQDDVQDKDHILQYSDLYIRKDGTKLCTVAMPVYDMQSWSYQKQIGTCVVLLDVSGFDNMLDQMLITDNSEMVITDRMNQVIAYMGRQENAPTVYEFDAIRGNDEYIVNETAVKGMDWKIVSIIPRRDVKEQFNYLQWMNIVTCLIVILLLLLFGMFCYRNILRPIKSLVVFVQEHLKQPQMRIHLHAANEIESLAGNLNRMLDEKNANSQRIQDMQKQVYELKILQKQAELLAYQSQIDPHFLYNTLDCIQSMAYEYGADQVAEIILDLSKMFRYSIAGDGTVFLRQELDHIRQYADIIECRFMGRITVQIQAEEESLNVQVPKLLLQPLMENAIFHGLERCSKGGSVKVCAKVKESDIEIEIIDNGHGIAVEELEKLRERLKNSKKMEQKTEGGTGIGLINIYQRLKLLYGNQAVFRIESQWKKGTKVILKLPREWEEKKDV